MSEIKRENVQQLKVNVVLPVTTDDSESLLPIRASLPGESSPMALRIYRHWYDDYRTNLNAWLRGLSGDEMENIRDAVKGGVYLLIGKVSDVDEGEKDAVYVGQTNNFCQRFLDHGYQQTGLSNWHVAICFIIENADESFRLAMERKIFDSINPAWRKTQRAAKSIDPDCSRNFQRQLEAMVAMTTALGHGEIFRNVNVGSLETMNVDAGFCTKPTSQIFVCKSRDHADAKGYETKDGKFIVMAGSQLSDGVAPEFKPLSYWSKRKQLDGDAEIVKDNKFIRDYEFRSSSEAAAVVRGRSSNGYDAWKTPDDEMTFGEYLKNLAEHKDVMT